MDLSLSSVAKVFLPQTALILRTAILSILSLSPNASKQSTAVEVTVAVLKSFAKIKRPIGYLQHVTSKERQVKGQLWISKTTFPSPQDHGVRDALVRAVKELGDGNETFDLPELSSVGGEWTGYRADAASTSTLPDISEQEKYNRLTEEATSRLHLLYFHGGGFIAGDPISHRSFTANLAKYTQGICFSVRYRLAPQHPFPAQILDALVAYLSLLAPPAGAFHQPIAASDIVFSGDSAGGNLALALLQVLLTLQKMGVRNIFFNGRDVPLQIPAGVAAFSPLCEVSCNLPSWKTNLKYDYLEFSPTSPGVPEELMVDSHWPTQPPRVQPYCNGSVLDHPLVSPINATPDMWAGMPPVFLCFGNECLEDDIKITARRMYHGGGRVILAGYEGMPHCFPIIFPQSTMGKDCLEGFEKFCKDALEGSVEKSDSWRWMKTFSNGVDMISFDEVSSLSDEEVTRRIKEAKDGTLAKEQRLSREREKTKARL